MTHKLLLLGAGYGTSVRCVALACTLISAPMIFADDAEVEAEQADLYTDYSVCRACDVSSADDPEVKHFAGLIAETRWSMRGVAEGIMIISNDAGDKADWYWTSADGVLETLEPANRRQQD